MTDDCRVIDPLVTPYVDGELSDSDRAAVDRHTGACRPCQTRVAAERSVRELIRARRTSLAVPSAPEGLHAKCARAAQAPPAVVDGRFGDAQRGAVPLTWRARLAPLAVAASLVLIVGAAFLYQLTTSSTRVLAAELTADHLKCFAVNGVLRSHDDRSTVESSMLSWFNWSVHLPEEPANGSLELVTGRPCLYGVGKVAHIMYRDRDHDEPVSLFMLPKTERAEQVVKVLGHEAVIWCANNRTFVLVARRPKAEVERIASYVRAALR